MVDFANKELPHTVPGTDGLALSAVVAEFKDVSA